jgi:hypothetical protein
MRLARIGLTTIFLLGGITFAMAQNGPDTKDSYRYGYYGYNGLGYYAQPRYAPYYSYNCRMPYYVLGYPVPHYGYKGWCFWR